MMNALDSSSVCAGKVLLVQCEPGDLPHSMVCLAVHGVCHCDAERGPPLLQSHARICIESALNAPGVENAYLDIEKLLAKLEALTGVLPASHQQFEAIYR